MGIDIESESISDGAYEAVKKSLTHHENICISSLPIKEPLALLIAWTAKEALSKAIKCGLLVPIQIFEIKELFYSDGLYHSTFVNFSQYKTLSFRYRKMIISIAIPEKSEVDLKGVLSSENDFIDCQLLKK